MLVRREKDVKFAVTPWRENMKNFTRFAILIIENTSTNDVDNWKPVGQNDVTLNLTQISETSFYENILQFELSECTFLVQ